MAIWNGSIGRHHMNKTRCAATFAAAMSVAGGALAHHSFAMFDNQKEVQIQGTVKEFQWTNPHIWIQIMVNEGGKDVEYSIEGASPNGLSRKGWKRTSIKAGDKVSLTIHPMKDGTLGGSLVSATVNGVPLV
jgi:hypothetical protein